MLVLVDCILNAAILLFKVGHVCPVVPSSQLRVLLDKSLDLAAQLFEYQPAVVILGRRVSPSTLDMSDSLSGRRGNSDGCGELGTRE